jgi:hypothetical protein
MYFTKHDIFKFEKSDIVMHITYELRLCEKFETAFDYLLTKLPIQKLKKDLGKMKWTEGKNYDWAIIQKNNVIFIIRKYGSHFTIFVKSITEKRGYDRTKYGCFMFSTDTKKMSDEESDMRIHDNFCDLNKYISNLFDFIGEDKIHALWNSSSFERDEYIKIKNVWNGSQEDISSIDDFIFCLEELFGKYCELFAETNMFEKIKTIKIGEKLGSYEVLSIKTELKDGYYHGVGLTLKGTNGADSKRFYDVYSLTQYYYDSIFPEEVEEAKKANEKMDNFWKNVK